MITTAFYGLSLAISAFIVGFYVWIFGDQNVSIIQGLLFAIVSTITSYILTRIFASSSQETPQGLDIYIGQSRKVKKVGDDYKVTLDGVDYFVEIDGLT
jgi:membrane protein implicated in regulation of membrane protease activity